MSPPWPALPLSSFLRFLLSPFFLMDAPFTLNESLASKMPLASFVLLAVAL